MHLKRHPLGCLFFCISSIRDDAARRPGGAAGFQALSMAIRPMLRAFRSAALARAPLADLLAHAPSFVNALWAFAQIHFAL